MKKITLFFSFLFVTCCCLNAQLVNNGGTITIQSNATLIVEGDVDHNSGTIVNNGTLSVEGNMTNDGTYTAGATSKLIMTGTTSSDLDMNGATVAILENAKTAGDVNLTSSVEVSEQVDFSGTSDIVLSDHNLVLAEAATTNGSATGHFVTDGIGKLNKEVSAAGTYTADVGDGTVYSPIQYVHSGTYSSSTINTSVTNMKHPDVAGPVAGADDYLNRYWETTTTIGTPNLQMTGTYDAGDVTGAAGDMVGARWESMEWEFATGAQNGTTVSATSTEATTELTGLNFYGKADLKVWLQAAYNTASDNMNTTLGTAGLIPQTSPYADAIDYDLPLAADIVDWIEIEYVGENGNPNVRRSALLKQDGSVVDVDGVSSLYLKDSDQDALINIYHRNHLPFSSATQVDLVSSTSAYDYSVSSNLYDNPAFVTDNAIELETGVYGMFRGNGNGDVNLTFIDYVLTRNNTTTSQSSVYSIYDINMDGNLSFIDYVLSRINSTTSKPAHLQ
jgi:hypothetical protein